MADAKTKTDKKTSRSSGNVWSDEEKAAMQASARERKAASRRGPLTDAEQRAVGEADIRAKLAELPDASDRAMAERFHELVTGAVPKLMPRTYYGMPAYARDGKTICFFKPASKFKERYATFGFEQNAKLDDGSMWPTSYALTEMTKANEARIVELVKKAAG